MRVYLLGCLALCACVALDPLEGDDPTLVEPEPVPEPRQDPVAQSGVSRIVAAMPNQDPGDRHWQLRGDREHLDAVIKLWTDRAARDPGSVDVRVQLARAHVFLADAFLREDAAAREDALDAAVGWAERALVVVSPEFKAAMSDGAAFAEASKTLGVDAVPALYWYARALGQWAQLKGVAVLLGQKDNMKAAMTVCLTLDPTYFHGGAERYFGSYFAVMPAFAGGDLTVATAHFERALATAPDFAETKLRWAVDLAVKQQDRETFERLIAEVLATADDAIPAVAPETRATKARAAEWLRDADDLF